MKRKYILAFFLTAIIAVNIFTYRLIKSSDDKITDETTSGTSTNGTIKTETENTVVESIDYTIITRSTEVLDDYKFNASPIQDTLPEKHLTNPINFGYIQGPDNVRFGTGSNYTDLEGVISFRGTNFRDRAAFGEPDVTDEKLQAIWNINIGYIDVWTGVGWTGQPLIVKWPDEIKQIMNIFTDKKAKKSLKEVIYATLDGKIYFLDLDDGKYTRDPIDTGVPHKGTPSLDPRGYPLLYAGQGINLVAGQRLPLGFRIFSLIDQKQLFFLDGNDPDKRRDWYAFDSSAVIDAVNDTVYEPGESGILYKIKLNTMFDFENAKISISPEIYKYRYDPKKNDRPGIENSMVTYMNYGYFADNSGFVHCIDLETLTPIWSNELLEDTDASLVAEEINGRLYLYSGSEVDFQGTSGAAYLRKIDGLTGEFIWERSYICGSDTAVNGGAMATPATGTGDLENYIFYNIAKIDNTNRSLLVALDKRTGQEIWRYMQNNYSWSSPLFFKSKADKYYLIQCDSIGQVILFDAKTGKVIDVLDLGINIEGSPAMFEDILVVGTRGQKIWGIKIS